MRKSLLYVTFVVAFLILFFCGEVEASWLESQNQGMMVRHPRDWKVQWSEQGFSVTHPQNEMIWCVMQSQQFQGSARQLAEAVVKRAAGQASDIKHLQQKQVSQRPDLYGIKFSGQYKGVPFTSLVLTATEDGRNFVIRQFSSPTKQYDEMKLTLIPVLCSFCAQGQAAGTGDSRSGGWQVIQSPQGMWRFQAPASWRPVQTQFGDDVMATVGSPDGNEGVVVKTGVASSDHLWLAKQRLVPQANTIPLMPAADLFQRIVLPYNCSSFGFTDAKIHDLKPLSPDVARFVISYNNRSGKRFMDEGIVKNSSAPNPQGGDFNLYSMQWVSAPADRFQSHKEELWRIVSTFEPSPQFGAFWVQQIMKMRRDTNQAAANMAMNNIRTNQNIMRQHVAVAQQKPGMMAQQGQGWINAVTGQEVVRDPQSGQRYQVPVGGQYIYGRNTGEVIRADRPLQTHELPEGFRQFEAAGIR
jgi:hypothetical protein